MINPRIWAAVCVGAALTVLAGAAPSSAAQKTAWVPAPTTYAYDGIAYDRLFLGRTHSRAGRAARPTKSGGRMPFAAGAPYNVTDLYAETGIYGKAMAVNNAGEIAYLGTGDYAYLAGDPDVVHDDGTLTTLGEPPVDPYGDAGAVPYALNNSGEVVGVAITEFSCCTPKHFHVDWTPAQVYFGFAFDGSFAYAVNDANVSVGQAIFSGAPAAAVFSISATGGDKHPVMLRPPKNTSWVGTATGINNAGEIVGYAKDRAVVFNLNGYAQVLPVGAAGVSTSAQAINQHGDIVGNAGGQAFLYRNHRVMYLPRPPGETSGNAVALAIDASDEIVGDIVDPATGDSTAFLYAGGRSYDLNALLPANSGFEVTHADGINDSGEIVGEALGSGGYTGVSLKPQSATLRATTLRNVPLKRL